MRIHYLQHVRLEGLDAIQKWADDRGHTVTGTHVYGGDGFPKPTSFDLLILLGGPMGVHDEKGFPWLKAEKQFLSEVISSGKVVLGVCLGAQLLAESLRADVRRNEHREIGWHPVTLTEEGCSSPLFEGFPKTFTPFHWHGDTFSIPEGAERLAESRACANQAFDYGRQVIGLQFHLEFTPASVRAMVREGGDELADGRYVQTGEQILSNPERFSESGGLLYLLLDNLERTSEAE